MTFEQLVERARADERVLGVILTGSRGRNVFAADDSDWDVRLVAGDADAEACRRDYGTERGATVEVVVLSLRDFERAGEPGPNLWDRYSYVDAHLAFDRDGRIAALLSRKANSAVDPAAALDDYVNALLRSLKNAKAGLEFEARLDVAESLAPLLEFVFALHDRVRPFNKFLLWELERRPLELWVAEPLPDRLVRVLDGDREEQRRMFRDIEALARTHGYGAVLDSWEPDLRFLRRG